MPSSEASAPAQPPTNELPQLSTYTAESEDDRIDGLNLIADSVAQQRQVASRIMIFHPINLAIFGVVMAAVAQYMRKNSDIFVFATTAGGITMTFLILVRWLTGGYIGLAEEIGAQWLGDDRVIVAKWGEDVIGALVLGWADGDAAKKRGRRRRGKAIVRGWTVKLKYRGKGVGEGLLEEAVKVAGEKGADGILFAGDHASEFSCIPTFDTFTDNVQTPNASSRQSTTASSTSRKQKPKRHYARWPTRRATSDSASRRPPGAADDRISYIEGGVRFSSKPVFFWKIPIPSLRYPTIRYLSAFHIRRFLAYPRHGCRASSI